MKVQDFLVERVLNALTSVQKRRYADDVWEILQQSYRKIGGFQSASSVAELIADSGIWKIVVRDGKISAVKIYKDRYGRKSIAAGTDGSAQGKRDLIMLISDDTKLNRSWVEVSGPLEQLMVRVGARPIPAKYAAALTGKKIMSISDDGLHYTRLIAGNPHEKIIYGVVNLDPAAKQELEQAGIDLKDLPQSSRN
jgi:hypothetical protein